MKKIISTILVIVLVLSSISFAFASDLTKDSADALHTLGLFNGTGVNADGTPQYSLEKPLTRAEMVTMMVKLLGKEKEALSGNWKTPFTDVPGWAAPYIGYAYSAGLVGGSSPTTFSSDEQASETQYLTLILRSLGYEDSKGDFVWNNARALSDKIGVTSPDNKVATFTRGNLAEISYAALATPMKNSTEIFAEKLIKDDVFSAETYAKAVAEFNASESIAKPVEPSKQETSKKDFYIPFGNEEVNKVLLALNPDKAEMSDVDNRLFHVTFNGAENLERVLDALDGTKIAGSKNDYGETFYGFYRNIVLVEINLADDGATNYTVNRYDSNKKIYHVEYSDRFVNNAIENGNSTQVNNDNLSYIPIGLEAINKALLGLNPDKIFEAGNKDGSLYHIVWADLNAFNAVSSVLNNMIPDNYIVEENTISTSISINEVRVEVSDVGNVIYRLELIQNGTMRNITFFEIVNNR